MSQINCPPLHYVNNGDPFAPKKSNQKAVEKQAFDVATNFFNNNQHVKTSLITLKVSAVCTVQQHPNSKNLHEATLRPVSEKSGTRTKG